MIMARGGARANAGRYPKGTTDGRKYVTIRLSQKACDFLEEQSRIQGVSRGKIVELTIDHFLDSCEK
jgi:hypothetical protein